MSNGFKTIYHVDNSSPVVCVQLYVKIGSAWEADDESGYSHILEHLLFKSTRDFSENQISKYLSSIGGSINAYTDFDCTCFYILLPAEYLEQSLHVLSEILLHPTFSAKDVTMEKDIVIEEQQQSEYDPELDLIEFIQTKSFVSNPLRNPVLGTASSIRSLTYNRIRQFYLQNYLPTNSFLVVTGAFIPDQLAKQVDRYFGGWDSDGRSLRLKATIYSFIEPPAKNRYYRKNDQMLVAFVLPELTESHPECDSLQIAMRHLAYGRSSRLYKRLVEQERLCSSVKVNSISGIHTGVSAIVVTPLNSDIIPKICEMFDEELNAICTTEIDMIELELIKKDMIFTWVYGFDGVENIANQIGTEEIIGDYKKLYSFNNRIQTICPIDVQDSAKKYWQPQFGIKFVQGPSPIVISKQEKVTLKTKSHRPVYKAPKIEYQAEYFTQAVDFAEISPGYYTATIPNGLQILYKHIPGKVVYGFSLSTDLCRLFEAADEVGVNYLTSISTLHSTTTYDHESLMEICRNHGLNIGIEHHADSTIWSGKCIYNELYFALTILNEIVFQPRLENKNTKTLKLATIDSLRRDKLNPASAAYQRWFKMLVGTHSPYDTHTGEITDLIRVTSMSVLGWHKKHYHPHRFSLAIIGSDEPKSLFAMVSQIFQSTDIQRDKDEYHILGPRPSSIKSTIKKQDIDHSIIHMGGFAVPARHHIQTTAFYVLAHILGGDMDSRMFSILREKHGLTYQTGFDYVSIRDFGYWNAYAYCDTKDYKKCLRLMQEIVSDVCSNGVTDEELSEAQNYLCGIYRFEQESVSIHSAMLANLSSLGYDPLYFENREQRIRSVDKNMISLLAQTWLKPENHYIHILR